MHYSTLEYLMRRVTLKTSSRYLHAGLSYMMFVQGKSTRQQAETKGGQSGSLYMASPVS